jgi:hypothetical protein
MSGASDGHIQTDLAWAEKHLIAILSDVRPADLTGGLYVGLARDGLTVAEAATIYSSIVEIMMKINSAETRRVLFDYPMSERPRFEGVAGRLCFAEPMLPVDDLLALERAGKLNFWRPRLLEQLLRVKHPAAERFLGELEEVMVYVSFRDESSPEVIAALGPFVGRLDGKARIHVEMLLTLAGDNPVDALLAMLDDPKWTEKNLALEELARIGDARVLAPLVRVLRDAPADYLGGKSWAVRCALEAIAHVKSSDAIRELIELLPVDLSRFGTDYDRNGFQRIVAAQLIELTGESFGTDVDAWREWFCARADNDSKP